MPRLVHQVPKYRKHRASGQAVVTLNGRDHYLGPHGSKASKFAYDRLISEWLASDRVRTTHGGAGSALTVVEVLAAYLEFARHHYVKDGRPTTEFSAIGDNVDVLVSAYRSSLYQGNTPLRPAVGSLRFFSDWGVILSLCEHTRTGADPTDLQEYFKLRKRSSGAHDNGLRLHGKD